MVCYLQAMITSIVWSVLLLLCCSVLGSTSSRSNGLRNAYKDHLETASLIEKWLNTMITGVVSTQKNCSYTDVVYMYTAGRK
jgi:hypothetical protein